MTGLTTRLCVAAVVAVAAAGFALGPAAGSAWADPGEAVTSFDVTADVDGAGTLRITETIGYRFAGSGHHGLLRELRTQAVRDGRGRVYPVTAVRAENPGGTPAPTAVTTGGSSTTIRVGDPARTVSGDQTYVLRYTLAGVFDQVSDPHPEDVLSWDFVGNGWAVPVEGATVRITAPRPADERNCSAQGCVDASNGTTTVFTAGPLTPGHGLLVTLDYPVGTVAAPRALPAVGAPPTASVPERIFGWTMLLVVLGGLGACAVVVMRMLREPGSRAPRHGQGARVHAVPVAGSVATAPVPITPVATAPGLMPDAPVVPLAAAGLPAPPPDLAPGVLGVLHAEGTGTDAVTATLLDLAVRGHLRIEEGPGYRGPADWTLVPTRPAAHDPLRPHEKALLDAAFDGRGPVRISTLCHRRADALHQANKALLAEGVGRGWLAANPVATWGKAASMCVFYGSFAAAVVSFAVRPFPYFFFCVLAGLVGGLLLSLFSAARPVRRTAAGDAVLAGLAPYQAQLTGTGVEQIPRARAAEVFSRSLPYAVALGRAHAWTRPFRDLFAAAPRTGATAWYVPTRPPDAGLGAVTQNVLAFLTAARERPAPRRAGGFSGSSDSGSSSSSSSSFDSGSSSSSSGGGSSW